MVTPQQKAFYETHCRNYLNLRKVQIETHDQKPQRTNFFDFECHKKNISQNVNVPFVKNVHNGQNIDCCRCYINITEKHVILDCGHINTCHNCLATLTNCPVCLRQITRFIRI